MKTPILIWIILTPIFVWSQSFTKLNNTDINAESADWFSVIPVDIDNNYTLDLILGNNGSNGFFLHTDSLGFTYNGTANFVSQTTNASSSYWADIDNDCDMDVFWAQPGVGNSLYENNGDGTFSAVTTSSLSTDLLKANCACWGDYNNDGQIDLYLARWNSTTSGAINYLYKNTGNFTFARIDTGVLASPAAASTAASWVDYDNDGDLDLYVSNRNSTDNDFYINNGNGHFTRDTSIITRDGANSSGCSWGDYDNDGYQDLFVTNLIGEKNHLYKNNGNGTFTKILTGSIVNDQHNSYSSFWADFDNDGYLDLFVANNSNAWAKNNLLYKNNGNGTFTKVTSGSQYTELLETYGTTSADLNEDGFIDIINPNRYNSPITIHLNNGNANGYLHLNLFGTSANRSAIGARVVARSALGMQTRTISQQSGNNHHDDLSIKMGFGTDTIIDSLTIYWPGSNTCVLTNITPGGFYNIEEGLCSLDTVIAPKFKATSSFLRGFFTSTGIGNIGRYHWDFGDGDTSNLANPTHQYISPGKYLVSLTAYDDYCKHRTYSDSIEVCPDNSTLGFIDTHVGLALTYTDTSSSTAYDFVWDFGDNTPAGSGKVVNHTYGQAGTYSVCLTLIDSCRTKTYCRSITVCNDTLLAGFGTSNSGLTVVFNDSSYNATSISWDFGDGGSSTSTNPSHTYAAPGYYVVCQTVQDICTSSTFCDTIGVCLDTAKANFNFTASALLYNFSDQSQNAGSYLWDFGDGSFSTNKNPAHLFPSFGVYKVCLTITNLCYTDSICMMVNVCGAQGAAAFTFQNSIAHLSIQFQSQAINAVSHYWDFGDGSFSTNKHPLNVFSQPIVYHVCLTITDSCGLQDSSCQALDLTTFSTPEWEWVNNLEVYPNPTSDRLFIKSTMELTTDVGLKLMNITGRIVLTGVLDGSEGSMEFDLSDLPDGIYLLNLKAGSHERNVKIEKL